MIKLKRLHCWDIIVDIFFELWSSTERLDYALSLAVIRGAECQSAYAIYTVKGLVLSHCVDDRVPFEAGGADKPFFLDSECSAPFQDHT